MGKPKSGISPSATGLRRSHLTLKLARVVNGKSPVKVYTTKRESGKVLTASLKPGARTHKASTQTKTNA